MLSDAFHSVERFLPAPARFKLLDRASKLLGLIALENGDLSLCRLEQRRCDEAPPLGQGERGAVVTRTVSHAVKQFPVMQHLLTR